MPQQQDDGGEKNPCGMKSPGEQRSGDEDRVVEKVNASRGKRGPVGPKQKRGGENDGASGEEDGLEGFRVQQIHRLIFITIILCCSISGIFDALCAIRSGVFSCVSKALP
jgi:hypothetical protein